MFPSSCLSPALQPVFTSHIVAHVILKVMQYIASPIRSIMYRQYIPVEHDMCVLVQHLLGSGPVLASF